LSRNIPLPEIKILFAHSGNMCAFPGCGKRLVEPGTAHDSAAVLAEIAHIVADSRQGPRGNSLLSDADRDRHPNLILLCGDHHKVIDSQPNTFSVSVLRQIKADHEDRIRRAVAPQPEPAQDEYTGEVIHSSLLPVTHLPEVVFAAPCAFRDRQEDEVKSRLSYPSDQFQIVRFLLRDGKLLTFHNLHDPKGPFADVIDRRCVEPLRATDLWNDSEGFRRYMTLLNRALYKYTALLGIRYDPDHYRYFFPVEEPGVEREVEYRPLNRNRDTRNVAWQPTKKSTGEKRNYWWHLGAGIRFHQMADNQWCMTLRPERHLTTDGSTPLPSDQIGRRVTSKKARMWNDVYLSELNFWRDYLSGGKPRFVLNFGDQSAVVGTQFITFDVNWPGIPGDEKPFRNQLYDEDLFSMADLRHATDGESFDWDETEDEDTEEEDEAV
jgi:hypothetical protein